MWFDTFYQYQAERRDVGNVPRRGSRDPSAKHGQVFSLTSTKGTDQLVIYPGSAGETLVIFRFVLHIF